MKWRLYYEDGSTYDAEDGPPQDSPVRGLVCVAQPCAKPDWYTVLTNFDWVLYREDLGYWTGHDIHGALTQLEDDAHNITAIRQGKYVPTPKFKALWAQAREDSDWEVSRG